MSDSAANSPGDGKAVSETVQAASDAGRGDSEGEASQRWKTDEKEAMLSQGAAKRAATPKNEKSAKGQPERRQELEHKLKSNPTDLDGFLELASIYREEQRPLESKRLLQQAAQIFPEDETIRFQLEEAILARSLQQLREVTDLANRLDTPEADRELERSRSDWACRRIDVCTARLQRDPSQKALRLALAEAKFDADMFEDSFTDAGQLLEWDEYAAAARLLRARSLLALGKDVPAMKELRAVALRRAVVAPDRLKQASLKMLCELSDKLSLVATGDHYREHLRRIEAAIESKPSQESL